MCSLIHTGNTEAATVELEGLPSELADILLELWKVDVIKSTVTYIAITVILQAQLNDAYSR